MKESTVKCEVCGRTEKVSFAYCLMTGWPKCHGYTMTLITTPSQEVIDQGVRGCIGNAQILVDEQTENKK